MGRKKLFRYHSMAETKSLARMVIIGETLWDLFDITFSAEQKFEIILTTIKPFFPSIINYKMYF